MTRAIVVICSVLSLLAASGAAQDRPKSIWDGVFTAEQADRGKIQYESWCAHCHGDDLTGGDGPSLVGDTFVRAYASGYLDRLFKKIQKDMPADDVTAVEDKDKLDVMTHLLLVNGFPPGKSELPLDLDYLSSIPVFGPDGPEPTPNGALVETVGCLVEDGKNWKLTNATEPAVATMDGQQATSIAAASRPLGKLTVGLLDIFPRPEQHIGRKMLVKGLLMRNNDNVSLNVLHLDAVGTTCTP